MAIKRLPAGGAAVGGALSLLLVGCGAPQDSSPGETVSASTVPSRVVSLLPAASAFVVDLGAGSKLIAVDPESARLPGLGQLPVVAPRDLPGLRPDLVLVHAVRPEDAAVFERLRTQGSEVVEVAPRDYEDVFDLCRGLGARLAGTARARSFESAMGRELGALAAASHGRPRPRVAAVLGLDPLEIAPAHSFATDLIEMAGGTSTTHDHQLATPPTTVTELAESGAPDLWLVLSATAMAEPARAAARAALGDSAPIEFFVLDTQRFWAREGTDAVRSLRAVFDELSPRRP